MDDVAGTSSGIQYRADYGDTRTFAPMEAVYGELRRPQQCCEEDLRAVREDGQQLEFRRVPGLDSAPTSWRMTVRTPKLQQFVGMGYTVVVVGSELEVVGGGPDWR
ncbi:hypothetical protein [Streptomyces noursei]|uniref:hypothetical protein n=1 Tax=Streptomyces noursei TaxID=1971 RepID=UPI00382ED0A9